MKINWGSITPEQFLKEYLQKKPLFIKGAFTDFEDPIDANELAGLAMEEHIESRIIAQDSMSDWQVEHGPFEDFSQFGEDNWTLLVQATNHWSAETDKLIKPFEFIPRWRIDDVMVSFSTPNGGVGPHLDQYDVFILQGEGRRRWQVGLPSNKYQEIIPHPDLKQISEFEPVIDVVTEQGDLLYIPPNHPHNGVSIENSLNFSIGFQAPNVQELLSSLADDYIDKNKGVKRFSDPDRILTEQPEVITGNDIDALQSFLMSEISNKDIISEFFASYLTKTHHGLELLIPVEPLTDEQVIDVMSEPENNLVPVSGIKVAQLSDEQNSLFINGDKFQIETKTSELARLLSQKQTLTNKTLKSFIDCLKNRQLLTSVLNKGYWYVE